MLHSITWGQFGLVIFIGLVLYYGYVLLRFYGREMRGFAQGKKNGADWKAAAREQARAAPEPAKVGPAGVVIGQRPQRMESGQGKIIPETAMGETPDLFKVTEKVIMLLRQVVNEAAATGVRRDELEDRMRMLLSGYRQLVKTPYQVSVNNFISRACMTTFSLQLSDREIAELWGP